MFLGRPGSAPTVDARIAGYCEALEQASGDREPIVCRINPEDKEQVRAALAKAHPDGIVCANDFTAAHLLKTLTELGLLYRLNAAGRNRRRQSTRAFYRFRSRLSISPAPTWARSQLAQCWNGCESEIAARDILLDFRLVIRDSCGARKKKLTVISRATHTGCWQ